MHAARVDSPAAAARCLAQDGIIVWDGFLQPSGVAGLIECAALRRERGEFSAARVGSGSDRSWRPQIRSDLTCWFADPLLPPERALEASFEQLRLAFNQHAGLGLFELELHYACYPPGSGYERHVDQPRGGTARVVSLILYLNAHWSAVEGGQLRLFAAQGGYRDVEPEAGRLVCFTTAEREHAVLPTRRERSSVSGWFRRRGDTPVAII